MLILLSGAWMLGVNCDVHSLCAHALGVGDMKASAVGNPGRWLAMPMRARLSMSMSIIMIILFEPLCVLVSRVVSKCYLMLNAML